MDCILDTSAHEDEKTIDVLAVFLQQDLILFLEPGFCTSPLRGQLGECPTLARMAWSIVKPGLTSASGSDSLAVSADASAPFSQPPASAETGGALSLFAARLESASFSFLTKTGSDRPASCVTSSTTLSTPIMSVTLFTPPGIACRPWSERCLSKVETRQAKKVKYRRVCVVVVIKARTGCVCRRRQPSLTTHR
jgi:hypothetical protein